MPRMAEPEVAQDGLAPERVMAVMEGLRAYQDKRIRAGLG